MDYRNESYFFLYICFIMKLFKNYKGKYFFSSYGLSRKKNEIVVLLLLIIIFTIVIFCFFDKYASSKFIYLGELALQKYTEKVSSDYKMILLKENNFDSFLEITENDVGEIISVDYDMNAIYQISENLKNYLQNNIDTITDIEISFVDFVSSSKDGFVLFMPLGIISNSVFLNNLGPSIPVLIRYIGSVFTNVTTEARDYGVNNVLLNIYLDVSISYEIIGPVTMSKKEFQYRLLLDSKLVQGKVPNLYGGYMNCKSSFFEVPFEKKV